MKKGIMEYVLALRECGYPAAAAQKCGVSSSTLMAAVKRTEAELEVPLYDGTARQLTRAGLIYAELCQDILAEDGALRRQLAKLKTKKLTIGHASYVDRRVTSQVTMRFLNAPGRNINVSVMDLQKDEPPEQLLNGELDIFLSCLGPSPSRRLNFIPVHRSPLYLAAPPDCPVDPRDPLSSVEHLKLISLFQGTILQRNQLALVRGPGRPEILMETNSAILTSHLISQGAGYTIVTKGLTYGLPQAKLYPIPGSCFTMGIWLLKEKQDLPQIQAICRDLCSCAVELFGNDPAVTMLLGQEGGMENVSQ